MAKRFSIETVFKAIDRVTAPVDKMTSRINRFTRAAVRDLNRLEKAAKAVTRSFVAGTKAAFKWGSIGIASAVGAATLLIKQFAKIENAEAAFTPLMRGAEGARKLVSRLNETAATTPFQFETLARQAQILLPVMNSDIEKTIDTLRMLGDTAGGNASKLESVTRGFTKAMLKGKGDMESLNIIAEAGIPIFQELAKQLNTTVDETFFKMVSAGMVTLEDINKAFKNMTQSGGIFFRGMEIASKTTTGLWSTLMDNIALTAATIGGILAPTVKDLIRQATEIAKQIRVWVDANRELIDAKFLAFVEQAKEGISSFMDKAIELNNNYDLVDLFFKTVEAGVQLTEFLVEHGKTIAWFLGIMGGLVVIGQVIGLVAKLSGAFSLITGMVLSVTGAVSKLIGIFGVLSAVGLLTPLGWIVAALAAIAGTIALIVTHWDQLMAAWDNFEVPSFGDIGRFLFGGDDEEQQTPEAQPQVATPQEIAASRTERTEQITRTELTLRDETGRLEVTGGTLGAGVQLDQTGTF